MRDLFAERPKRFEKMSASFGSILLDYSKNIATDETFKLLGELVDAAGVRAEADRACSPARRSTTPRSARCCTWRCATARTRRSSSTAST